MSRGERTRVRARVLRRATHLPATCIIVVGVASWPPHGCPPRRYRFRYERALRRQVSNFLSRFSRASLESRVRDESIYDQWHLRARAREICLRLDHARDWFSLRLSGQLYLHVRRTYRQSLLFACPPF